MNALHDLFCLRPLRSLGGRERLVRRRPAVLAALCAALLTACAGVAPTSPLAQTPASSPAAAGAQASPAEDVCHLGGVTYCALNPAVTDANVRQTICDPSWTRGLRPPVSLTEQWKREVLAAYHLPGSIRDYEGDHRMPEADLGGDPGARLVGGRWVMTDQLVKLPTGAVVPANFADESPPSPNPKDRDETALHDEVCAGRLTLTEARIRLRDRWLLPYPGYRA